MGQRYPVPSKATFVSHFTSCMAPAATLFFSLSLSASLAGLSPGAYGAEDPQSSPAALVSPDIEDDSVQDGDDGSSALPDRFKTLNPEDVQEITLEEEQTLLGNWGDTEVEDGD